MHNRARIVAPIVLLVILIGGGYYWWNQRAATAVTSAQLGGSGTIEAEDVLITAEVGGRIKSLAVDEGQDVAAGQTLAQLDTALLEAQHEQARAAVDVAEANLAQLQAGAREEDVLAAQAQVDQARALRDGAATTDNSFVNFALPHSGQVGCWLEFTKSSDSRLHSWQRYS